MRLTRRRFLVAATAAAFAARVAPQRWEWRGSVMGAEARIVLAGPRDESEDALAAVVAEIDRLEEIFSLSRPSSQLSRLNLAGTLAAPAHDLVAVLSAARHWKHATSGAFDPAVQPLWEHWARGAVGSADAALAKVRGADIRQSGGQITLAEETALSLNGIAQGTIADRVADLLISRGFMPPLIDAGEMRLPGSELREIELPAARLRLRLAESAVATSEPGALVFDPLGRHHHLFDPLTGDSPGWWRSVTVIAPRAEAADALSTAFAVAPPELVGDLAASLDDVAVVTTDREGSARLFGTRHLVSGSAIA